MSQEGKHLQRREEESKWEEVQTGNRKKWGEVVKGLWWE